VVALWKIVVAELCAGGDSLLVKKSDYDSAELLFLFMFSLLSVSSRILQQMLAQDVISAFDCCVMFSESSICVRQR
jgi:hypothetical protein